MKQLLAGIRKPNNEKGVTLIELLICIALLGIFIIVALRLFDNGVKNYTTEASKAESDASLRQAMDVILSDIRKSGAKATQYDENKAEHTYTFKGQTNTDGHLCVIKFENSQIKITFDSNEITLLGSVYDFTVTMTSTMQSLILLLLEFTRIPITKDIN